MLKQPRYNLMPLEDVYNYDGSGGGGGGGSFPLTNTQSAPLVGSNTPTQQFDISVLSGLRPSDKYLGKNRVSDITEAYATYTTGNPVGKGGQYAIDAARRYGTTITEAARGYLVAAGLPTLADILPITGGGGGNTDNVTRDDLKKIQDDIKKQFDTINVNNKDSLTRQLIDALPNLFGGSVYNPPLQNQSYGYSPAEITGSNGGGMSSNIGTWLILGGIALAVYFIYKKVKG